VRAVPTRFNCRYFVAAVGLALLATSCSSPAATKTAVPVIPTTNTGLCKLVNPSVVATVLQVSMEFPETLTQRSSTECVYKSKDGSGQAVLIRYDTDSSESSFTRSEKNFERRGMQLGPVNGLGDKAYYFSDSTGHSTVTTVVILKGSLQVLVSGSGSVDQIGSIARYTLSQYETTHSPAGP
jgi:hypothetical protein